MTPPAFPRQRPEQRYGLTLGGFGWLSSVPPSSLGGKTVQCGDAGLGIRINWFFTWVNKLDQSRVSGRLKPGGHAVSGGLCGTAFVLWSVFGISLPPTLESPVVPYCGLLNAWMFWIYEFGGFRPTNRREVVPAVAHTLDDCSDILIVHRSYRGCKGAYLQRLSKAHLVGEVTHDGTQGRIGSL